MRRFKLKHCLPLLALACCLNNGYAQPTDAEPVPAQNSPETLKSPQDAATSVRPVDFGIEMVVVEGGEFAMGCTPEQGNDCGDNERPVHRVMIGPFEIGKTEVTQRQWQAVMGNNPSYFKGDNLPVEQVCQRRWDCPKENSVEEFISRLNERTGSNYRLPTEAEWEYAARGGNKSKGYKYSGSNKVGEVAWYSGNSSYKTHKVCTKKTNELGLCDMSGNVWEWVQNWFDGYANESQINPVGQPPGSGRVLRGGGWNYHRAEIARASFLHNELPPISRGVNGFRLVRSLYAQPTEEEALRQQEQKKRVQSTSPPAQESMPATLVRQVDFGIEMVVVEGGTFTMGCTPEQGNDCHHKDEYPAHQVRISSFEIGKTEVTQRQWQAVMGNNPSRFKGDNLPVERVCWGGPDCEKGYSVEEFIRRLNEKTGRNYRLPAEAEWEYAARGGNKSKGYKYSGSDTVGEVAWYSANRDGSTHDVCTKTPNELGLCDMSGNVSEWVQDWDGDYANESQTNPVGQPSGSGRVLRGGGWNASAWLTRVSFRDSGLPWPRRESSGFRLAHSF